MDRASGLSVRLKLTLSYAAFLMLAGAVLLAVMYLSLSRGVHPGVTFMVTSHSALVRDFAPTQVDPQAVAADARSEARALASRAGV